MNVLVTKLIISYLLAFAMGAAQPKGSDDRSRLLRLEQLSWSVLELTKAYVDPKRFEPKEMLKEGFRAVENVIPDLLVDEGKLPDALTLRMNNKSWTGNTQRVQSIWEMYMVLRQGLGFVARHLPSGVDAGEVELAVVNGMLKTLDPHSVMFSAQAHEEMRMSTQGAFGGLGIVISQRDGWLTVISPIAGTPASRAGVRARDQIVQINDETTENMTLEEAVSRLRGEPGTDVTVHLRRKGTKGHLEKTLTREIIKVRSVTSHNLGDGIGYVRIKSFRETTTDDTVAALAELRQAGAKKGLILDLRDNPGGLLEQAVAISDLFLDKGVIVTTVGLSGQLKESRYAHASGSLTDLPLMILISGGSASASEIVAGAVRNHRRGLLLGSQSFGKGSVQTIIPYRPRRSKTDGSALKLTIAQYLTPGEISIQGTGIVPDIELESVYIDEGEVYLTPRKGTKEADLDHALKNNKTQQQKTRRTLNILDTDETLDRDEQTRRENSGEFVSDLQVRMAKKLLLEAGHHKADTFYAGAGKALDEIKSEEDLKLVKALKAEGIDWTPTAAAAPGAKALVRVEWPERFVAGSRHDLAIVVENPSQAPIHRVVVRSKATLDLFDHREWVFGKIMPGETQRRQLRFELPLGIHDRTEFVRFEAEAQGVAIEAPKSRNLVIAAAKRPRLAYTLTVDDGNDGRAAIGETVSLHFAVGALDTDAKDLHLSVRAKRASQVKMVKARAEQDTLTAGGTWNTSLSVKVRKSDQPIELTVNLGARKSGLWYTERLIIPVTQEAQSATPCAAKAVTATARAELLRSALSASYRIGYLEPGQSLACIGTVGEFHRVRLPRQGVAYVARAAVTSGEGKAPKLAFARTPPSISLPKGLVTDLSQGKQLMLSARASDELPLHNVVVYRGRKKVLFASGGKSEIAINQAIDLEPGQNLITLHAREGVQYGATKSFWVLRREGWDPEK